MTLKDKPWFPVAYMFLATACASILLIGLARMTRARVAANEQLMFERAALEAFPAIRMPPAPEVHARFNQHFEKAPAAAGAYVCRRGSEVLGYAVPVSGRGFWAPIRGVAGVSAGLATLTGLGFYDQNETPGLGARITEREFRRQFSGLAVGPPARPVGIRPPSSALNSNEVHGITGATQTCRRLEQLLNRGLSEWLAKMTSREAAP